MYEKKFNREITNCGLVVNPKWPWLGCSPDGITLITRNYNVLRLSVHFRKGK